MRNGSRCLLASVLTSGVLGATAVWGQTAAMQEGAPTIAVVAQKKETVDVTVPDAFKGASQVVIGSFKVGFINHNKATAKSGGGIFSGDKEARVVLRSKLEGLPPAHMQAIVDTIYADFTAQLKGIGYTVLDRSALTEIPAFAAISGAPSPYAVNGVSVVPQAEALYFAPTGQNVIQFIGEAGQAPGLAALANIGSQISAGQASAGMQEIAEKNKLAIVNVHYVLNFVNAEGTGGYTQRLTSVSLNQGLTVMPGSTVSIITGYESTFSTKNGSLSLSTALASDEQFGEFSETTSSLEKAVGVFSMVTGGLTGGSSSNTGEYTITASPDAYQKIATQLLTRGNADFISTMASLK